MSQFQRPASTPTEYKFKSIMNKNCEQLIENICSILIDHNTILGQTLCYRIYLTQHLIIVLVLTSAIGVIDI